MEERGIKITKTVIKENGFKYLAMYRKNRDLDKCFATALSTFDYLMSGENRKIDLKPILESLNQRGKV